MLPYSMVRHCVYVGCSCVLLEFQEEEKLCCRKYDDYETMLRAARIQALRVQLSSDAAARRHEPGRYPDDTVLQSVGPVS